MINFSTSVPEKTAAKIKPLFEILSPQSSSQLMASCAKKEFEVDQWVLWIHALKGHAYFKSIENLFLEYCQWSELNLAVLVKFIKTIIDHGYTELFDWCLTVFKPTYAVTNAKLINECISLFAQIVELLHQKKLAIQLPKLKGHYAIHLTGLDSLKLLNFVLSTTSELSIQLQLVNDLPNYDVADQLFKQKYPFVCSALKYQPPKYQVQGNLLSFDNHYDINSMSYSVLQHAAKSCRDHFLLAYAQVQTLNHFHSEFLDKDDCILVLKRYWAGFFQEKSPAHIELLLLWAERVLNTLGSEMFLLVFDSVQPKQKLATSAQNYIELCQLLIELEEDVNCKAILLKNMLVADLVKELLKAREDVYRKKFPEKSLDQALKDFSTVSTFVRFPLQTEELAELKKEYVQIETLGKSLQSQSQAHLFEKIESIKTTFKSAQGKFEARKSVIEALAIIREVVRMHFKIYPYNTQILSVLALTRDSESYKGRIGQIGTGEGKSLIVCMLAVLQALQGNFVDIITSSRTLAVRDQQKFQAFFALFKISSSHICYDHPERAHFAGQIIYGTNYDFEFSIMRDGLFNADLRHSKLYEDLMPRKTDVAIVDEADNLFIDAANNSARMSVSSPIDHSWVYPIIAEYVKKYSLVYTPNENDRKKLHNQLEEFRKKHHPSKSAVTEAQVQVWLNSAVKAFFTLKQNVDYVIQWEEDPNEPGQGVQRKITIVDYKNTGQLSTGSRWSNGLHEFVEIKHGIVPRKEGLTAASMSHPAFFMYYKKVYGLTGTVGEEVERKEIQEVYSVDTFDVPRHRPSLRDQLPAKIYPSIELYQKEALRVALEKSANGQPVLILVNTIEDSIILSEHFKKNQVLHQLLNTQQAEDEEYVIGRAGIGGVITIATSIAGRGTDILLSAESKRAGGLHVVFGFYPENLRVENQGLGRAGRQGQKGTCHLLLHMDDMQIRKLFPIQQLRQSLVSDEKFIDTLNAARTRKIQGDSEIRKLRSHVDTIHHEVLKKFFTLKVMLYELTKQLPLDKLAELFIKNIDKFSKLKIETLSDEINYQTIALRKIKLLIDEPSKDLSKWKAALLFAVDAFHENIAEKWALFFTSLEKKDAFPSDMTELEQYGKNILSGFLEFVDGELDKSFKNIVQSYLSYVFRLINHKEVVCFESKLDLGLSADYVQFRAEFYKNIECLENNQRRTLGS